MCNISNVLHSTKKFGSSKRNDDKELNCNCLHKLYQLCSKNYLFRIWIIPVFVNVTTDLVKLTIFMGISKTREIVIYMTDLVEYISSLKFGFTVTQVVMFKVGAVR